MNHIFSDIIGAAELQNWQHDVSASQLTKHAYLTPLIYVFLWPAVLSTILDCFCAMFLTYKCSIITYLEKLFFQGNRKKKN